MALASPSTTYGLNKVGLSTESIDGALYTWSVVAGNAILLETDEAEVTLKVNAYDAPQAIMVEVLIDNGGNITSEQVDITHLEAGTNPANPCDGYVLINRTIKCDCC